MLGRTVLTLHHPGYLVTDAGGEGGRVSAETAGGVDGCLNFHLVIRFQPLMNAGRREGELE